MSYCRWSDHSDVYVYDDIAGGTTCCACSLHEDDSYNVATHAEMAAHLRDHITAGHKVPDSVIEAILETEDGP